MNLLTHLKKVGVCRKMEHSLQEEVTITLVTES